MLKKYWNNTPPYLKNKYILTTIVFAFWMLFFDQHDLISQLQLQSELKQYKTDKEYYQDKITVSSICNITS